MTHHHRQAGFTLIEILVVLTVLGIVAGIAIGAFPQRGGRLDVAAAAVDVADALRLGRAQSIDFGTPVTFSLDSDGHGYLIGRQHRALPAAVMAAMAGPAEIRFDRLGGANGGAVRIVGRALMMLVRVDWLTGRVVVEEAS